MSTPPITVVATTQGFWTQWVNRLLTQMERTPAHADPTGSDGLDTALGERPEARALVLVEHPASGLARILAEGDGPDPAAWLSEWLASGRAVLAHAQRNPDECLLVNVDDARRQPARLAELLKARWGESFDPTIAAVPVCLSDPLAEALAWSFIDRHPAVQGLAEELLASCVILPGDTMLVITLAPRGATDGAGASQRLAELVRGNRRLEHELREADVERGALRRGMDEAAAQYEAAMRELFLLRKRAEDGTANETRLESELQAAVKREAGLAGDLQAARSHGEALAGELQSATSCRQALQGELLSAVANVQSLTAELQGVRSQLEQTSTERTRLEQGLRTSKDESDLLLQQLHLVQEELERTFQAKREIEQARDALKAEAVGAQQQLTQMGEEHEQTRKTLEQTRTDFEQIRKELEQARKAGELAQQELAKAAAAQRDAAVVARAAADARERLEQELRVAKEEGDLLLAQLHQVQEELEQMFFARRDADNALIAFKNGPDAKKLESELRTAREESELLTLQMSQVQRELERTHHERMQLLKDRNERIALRDMDDIAIGDVAVVGERDTPPHREVSFLVRDVRAGQRRIAEANVRLVEHWGRPGLAVFVVDGQCPLFEAWQESGREDGRPYMLLVHGEESAQRACDAMGTLDWQLVQALAVRLRQALLVPDAVVQPGWGALAQRLLASLQEQPARLRHDGVRVVPIAQESPETARWGLLLERASYKGRTWPRLTMQWRPNGPRASLELMRDDASGQPLLTWPADDAGLPVRALRLPVAGDLNSPEVREPWAALSASDKAFLGEMLNLLPMLAVHVQASNGAPASGVDLQAAARLAIVVGRTSMSTPPATATATHSHAPLLRRVVRRLRAAAQPRVAQAPSSDTVR